MAEIQGHLTLIGDSFDPETVTQRLGHMPTWQKRKDDILRNGRIFGHSEWGVATEVFVADDFPKVASMLMSILSCSNREIAQIAHDLNAKWNILFSINIADEFPVITLSPAFSSFASEIGAEIGFDVV